MLLDGNVNPGRGEIFTEEDLKILGERKAIVYVVERSNVRPDIKHHQKWASYGINVISVRDQFAQISGTTGNTHMNVDADFTEKGLINYLTGQGTITTDKFRNDYDYFLPTTIFDKNTGEEIPFDIRGKNSSEVKAMLGINSETNNNSQLNIEINKNDIKYQIQNQNQVSSNLISNKMKTTFIQTGTKTINVEPKPAYNLLAEVNTQKASNTIEIYAQQASPNIQKETINMPSTTPITQPQNIVVPSTIKTSYQQETPTYTYTEIPESTNHIEKVETTYNIEEYPSIPDTSVNESYTITKEENDILSINNYILPGIILTGIGSGLAVFGMKKEKQSEEETSKEE